MYSYSKAIIGNILVPYSYSKSTPYLLGVFFFVDDGRILKQLVKNNGFMDRLLGISIIGTVC